MSMIDEILRFVQRTNPNMTKADLLYQMGITEYSAIALYISCMNKPYMLESKEKGRRICSNGKD